MENALDWILAQVEKPDIVSLSLGSLVPLIGVDYRVKQLWDQGIIVPSCIPWRRIDGEF